MTVEEMNKHEKCTLCSECESRIRHNGKAIETGSEELKNILQCASEILQYVGATENKIPKEKMEYLLNGIKTIQKILCQVQ